MEIRPDTEWVDSRYAAEIIDADPTDAAAPAIIIHRKPLTVVVATDADPATTAPLATVMVDALIANGELTFAPVAEALQAFVVAHQPTGVAALLDVAPDPIVFLFDQAIAIEPGATHRGEGRSGWNTVFVGGEMVSLVAGTAHFDKADALPGWSRLFAGTVPGAGARTALALVDASKLAETPEVEQAAVVSDSAPVDAPAEANLAADLAAPAAAVDVVAGADLAHANGAALFDSGDQPVDLSEAATETRAIELPTPIEAAAATATETASPIAVSADETVIFEEPIAEVANGDLDLDLDLAETDSVDIDEDGKSVDEVISADDLDLTKTGAVEQASPQAEQVDWFRAPVEHEENPPVPVGAPPIEQSPPASPPSSFAIEHEVAAVPPPPPNLEPEPWTQPGQPPLPDIEAEQNEPSAVSLAASPAAAPTVLPSPDLESAALPSLPDPVSLADLPPPPVASQAIADLPPPPQIEPAPVDPALFSPAQSGLPPMPGGETAIGAIPEHLPPVGVEPEPISPISAAPPWPDVAPLPADAKPEPLDAIDLSKLPPPPEGAEPSK